MSSDQDQEHEHDQEQDHDPATLELWVHAWDLMDALASRPGAEARGWRLYPGGSLARLALRHPILEGEWAEIMLLPDPWRLHFMDVRTDGPFSASYTGPPAEILGAVLGQVRAWEADRRPRWRRNSRPREERES